MQYLVCINYYSILFSYTRDQLSCIVLVTYQIMIYIKHIDVTQTVNLECQFTNRKKHCFPKMCDEYFGIFWTHSWSCFTTVYSWLRCFCSCDQLLYLCSDLRCGTSTAHSRITLSYYAYWHLWVYLRLSLTQCGHMCLGNHSNKYWFSQYVTSYLIVDSNHGWWL